MTNQIQSLQRVFLSLVNKTMTIVEANKVQQNEKMLFVETPEIENYLLSLLERKTSYAETINAFIGCEDEEEEDFVSIRPDAKDYKKEYHTLKELIENDNNSISFIYNSVYNILLYRKRLVASNYNNSIALIKMLAKNKNVQLKIETDLQPKTKNSNFLIGGTI